MYRLSAQGSRRGVASAWVVVAMVALMGAAAMAIDLGKLIVAAQRCQDVADSAALAGGTELPYHSATTSTVLATVQANNEEGTGWPVSCSSEDITFLGPGDTVAGMTLGQWSNGVQVEVHGPVQYSFARMLGLDGAVAHRRATVVRGPVEGVPICTMWMADADYVQYQQYEMLMADGPHYAGIPGSFGFLQSPEGCTADWFSLLQGYGLTYEDIESSFVRAANDDTGAPGTTLYAKTGVDVGHFVKALDKDQGCARLERATDPDSDWASDTIDNFHADNPRIMLIPLVTYLGDTGSNAMFRIEKFGAFWLESVNQGQKSIKGRFIQYNMPGGDPNIELQHSTGLFATKLIR